MLGKLIKYDFRSCIRRFGPLWLGMVALALINGFTIGHVLDNGSITGWAQFAFGVMPLILLICLDGKNRAGKSVIARRSFRNSHGA